jgi:PAS domain S-box-containing protein
MVPRSPDSRAESPPLTSEDAESVLRDLAAVFFTNPASASAADSATAFDSPASSSAANDSPFTADLQPPDLEAMYRILVEQIPAVVFMAYLDRGSGSAYVSPRIEEALGFSQEEWLEDPVRWYHQIHPDDQVRWSVEAAEMFLSGKPLRSAYRVLSRSGQVVWFQCEAKMIRREDGRPWFIHGVGFDITELKRTEQALQEERNIVSAIHDTVGALIVLLGPEGHILRSNRACERISGYPAEQVRDKYFWDLFMIPEEAEGFRRIFRNLHSGEVRSDYESYLVTADGERRRITWSSTVLPGADTAPPYIIATGIDITERKRMEQAILEISSWEQRRIGHDLHDGLGQHLTGIAFMSKVLQQRLMDRAVPEAGEAGRIVGLVNEAINKTRELARGLLPVVSDAHGLMGALQQWAGEVEDLFQVPCRFDCPDPVLINDVSVATHVYLIAHEAVSNALRHGRPAHIEMSLVARDGAATLTVEDDGIGLPRSPTGHTGLGVQIMNYRANMVGGSLDLRQRETGGTVVSCKFPLRS